MLTKRGNSISESPYLSLCIIKALHSTYITHKNGNPGDVKGRIRRRRFIIAIDETHEPFYGKIKNLWTVIIQMASKALPDHMSTSWRLLYPAI
jgi:hypothetical protein